MYRLTSVSVNPFLAYLFLILSVLSVVNPLLRSKFLYLAEISVLNGGVGT